MTEEPRLTVFLDACVLYPAPLRDFLLHLAAGGLYKPKWTDRIHEEWTRNLLANRPDLTAAQLARTIDAMNRAFPDAMVEGDEALQETIYLPDEDDRHVVVGAIRGDASVILTINLKDFPAARLQPFHLEALHPDAFIKDLVEFYATDALQAFTNQVANLKNPPRSPPEVLQTLGKNGLTMTVEKLAQLLELDDRL